MFQGSLVPRNLWLSSLRRRQELLWSARERVQNALRHFTQTKPDSMLLRSYVVSWAEVLGSFPTKWQLCFDLPTSKTCSSPLTWILQVRRDAPEVATVMRSLKLTRCQVTWRRSSTTSPARAVEILNSSTLDELHGFSVSKASWFDACQEEKSADEASDVILTLDQDAKLQTPILVNL